MSVWDIVGWIVFWILVCCVIAGGVIFVKKVTLYPEDKDEKE